LWLVVLAMAVEEPMHPYRMQALIEQRGKNLVANASQRNSVYQTIDALRRAGLIAVRETSRDERRPERTVYEATPEGRRTLLAWMRTMLATPAREFPDFPAALSLLMLLPPKVVAAALDVRTTTLEQRLAGLEKPYPDVPRLFLLESEYLAALTRTELSWLRGVVDDLKAGRLTWSEAWLRRMAAGAAPADGDRPTARPRSRSSFRSTSRRPAPRRRP
jgi:DNA-binding PadR family transcriptional regulator